MRAVAMLILLLCIAATGCGGCGWTGGVVKTQVRNLQGCDADDAKAIVAASAAIVAAAAEARNGGDKVTAMFTVIEQLAIINERWKHCKATAGGGSNIAGVLVDARASPVGLASDDIDAGTLAELLAR